MSTTVMSETMSQELFFPDVLANWKYPRVINPDPQNMVEASARWTASFNLLDPGAQKTFDKAQFGLLSRLAYPNVSSESLRICCDVMNLFFIADDRVDYSGPEHMKLVYEAIIDAFRNPTKPRPAGELVVGEMARQLWVNAVKSASPSFQKRFVDTFDEYLLAIVQESRDHSVEKVHSIESYLDLRCRTIGVYPSFALLELELDLPDEVLEHPLVKKLTGATTLMIAIGNDLLSYNKEQAVNTDDHNIIGIIMRQSNANVQDAVYQACGYHAAQMAVFDDAYAKLEAELPIWGARVDAEAIEYVDGMGNWVRASDQWSYETQRYFGEKGMEFMRTRTCTLLPKKVAA